MINLNSNYLQGSGEGFFSSLNYAQIRQENARKSVQAALSGLPKAAESKSSIFSAEWLSSYLDAKAASPKIIRNYLKKIEDTVQTGETGPKRVDSNFHGIVDAVLDRAVGEKRTSKMPNQREVVHIQAGLEACQQEIQFSGILGEIFDQHA